MRILITGGAGYIGSILSETLINSLPNFKITIVDNFSYNQNPLSNICYIGRISIINSDYRDFINYKKNLDEADIIIPLAGYVGAPICKKKKYDSESVNLENQIKLFEKISDQQIVLMPTTNSAYGTNDDNICDENSKLKPISEYARQKVILEEKLFLLKNFVSLRLATVFGLSPRMRLDLLVNDFVFRAKFDGFIVLYEKNFKRNYIHVRDVAQAFLLCIKNLDKTRGQIYNVGLSNANLSKIELCNKIKNHINFNIIINETQKDPDQRNYIVSNKKIENLGFSPKFSIDDGIKELLIGYEGFKFREFSNI